MDEQPNRVKVELSATNTRDAEVVQWLPLEHQARVRISPLARPMLVERHPIRPDVFIPVEGQRSPSPPPSSSGCLRELGSFGEFLAIVISVAFFLAQLAVGIASLLRYAYTTIPQKTWDRVLLIYGGGLAGIVFGVQWALGSAKLGAVSPHGAYTIGLKAFLGIGLLFAGIWRLYHGVYPFDVPGGSPARQPSAGGKAGLLILGVVLLFMIAAPCGYQGPPSLSTPRQGVASSPASDYNPPVNPQTDQPGGPAQQPESATDSPGNQTPSETVPVVQVVVPAVRGLAPEAAKTKLGGMGLRVGDVQTRADNRVEEGRVIECYPGSSQSAEQGTAVTLVVSSGPPMVSVVVCTRSGLKPGRWCRSTESRSFRQNAVPTQVCGECKPRCQYCGQTFDDESQLNYHLGVEYSCPMKRCGEWCESLDALKEHQRKVPLHAILSGDKYWVRYRCAARNPPEGHIERSR